MKLTIGLNKLLKVTEIDKKLGLYIDRPFSLHIYLGGLVTQLT